MLTVAQRAAAVCEYAWTLLPPCKKAMRVSTVALRDLGAKHGVFESDTGRIILHRRLFEDPFPLIDQYGMSPPQDPICVSRALHTALHEAFHAIGYATGLDKHPRWLAISGWRKTPYDRQETDRYYEHRPGWEQGFSEWRHRQDVWCWRDYSRKAPAEDFADCGTLLALGWDHLFAGSTGLAKRTYLMENCWGNAMLPLEAAYAAWEQHLSQYHMPVG